jgi:hypothetical protein
MCDTSDDELWFDNAIVDRKDEGQARKRAMDKERCRREHPGDEAEIKRFTAEIYKIFSDRRKNLRDYEPGRRRPHPPQLPRRRSRQQPPCQRDPRHRQQPCPSSAPVRPPSLAITPHPTLTLRSATELGADGKGLSVAAQAYGRRLAKADIDRSNRSNVFVQFPPPRLPPRNATWAIPGDRGRRFKTLEVESPSPPPELGSRSPEW